VISERKLVKIRKILLSGGWRSIKEAETMFSEIENGNINFLVLTKSGKIDNIRYNMSKGCFEKTSRIFKPIEIRLNKNELIAWKYKD